MNLCRFAIALYSMFFAAALNAQETSVLPMPQALVSQAEKSESEARAQFQREVGHEPRTNREFLAWLDKKSLNAASFTEDQKDALVQSYGAVLGQIILHEFGGTWVIVPSEHDSPGVDLPNGKVAFVFNRAARRIFDGDSIGFVSFYEATASYIHGNQLPAGVAAKSKH